MRLHAGDDLLIRGFGMRFEQRYRFENHSRGAITALKRSLIEEGALNRVQFPTVGESLNGGYALALGAFDRGNAGQGRLAFDQDGASTALSFATSVLGSGQTQIFPEYFEQRSFRVGGERVGLAINRESERLLHRQLAPRYAPVRCALRSECSSINYGAD